MTIAGSIILIMIGAILTWAVEFDLAGLNINVVGVILMLGGFAGLLFGLYRSRVARRTVIVDDARTGRQGYVERRYDEPPV
jgi:uncharacterized membrane protein